MKYFADQRLPLQGTSLRLVKSPVSGALIIPQLKQGVIPCRFYDNQRDLCLQLIVISNLTFTILNNPVALAQGIKKEHII